MTIAASSPILQAKVAQLETENEELRWKVRDLQQKLWGRKSERTVKPGEGGPAHSWSHGQSRSFALLVSMR